MAARKDQQPSVWNGRNDKLRNKSSQQEASEPPLTVYRAYLPVPKSLELRDVVLEIVKICSSLHMAMESKMQYVFSFRSQEECNTLLVKGLQAGKTRLTFHPSDSSTKLRLSNLPLNVTTSAVVAAFSKLNPRLLRFDKFKDTQVLTGGATIFVGVKADKVPALIRINGQDVKIKVDSLSTASSSAHKAPSATSSPAASSDSAAAKTDKDATIKAAGTTAAVGSSADSLASATKAVGTTANSTAVNAINAADATAKAADAAVKVTVTTAKSADTIVESDSSSLTPLVVTKASITVPPASTQIPASTPTSYGSSPTKTLGMLASSLRAIIDGYSGSDS
jgi:hypothetical protein